MTRFVGLLAAAVALLMGTGPARASFYLDFPDAFRCDITDNPALGSVIFVIDSRNTAGITLYRTNAPAGLSEYVFNGDGSFNSKNYPHATNCDNQSLANLVAAGRGRFFSDTSGVSVPAGAMMYFNLAACLASWTRQIQLDRTINPDQPLVLCRKD